MEAKTITEITQSVIAVIGLLGSIYLLIAGDNAAHDAAIGSLGVIFGYYFGAANALSLVTKVGTNARNRTDTK